jgi:hypothetical protein
MASGAMAHPSRYAPRGALLYDHRVGRPTHPGAPRLASRSSSAWIPLIGVAVWSRPVVTSRAPGRLPTRIIATAAHRAGGARPAAMARSDVIGATTHPGVGSAVEHGAVEKRPDTAGGARPRPASRRLGGGAPRHLGCCADARLPPCASRALVHKATQHPPRRRTSRRPRLKSTSRVCSGTT